MLWLMVLLPTARIAAAAESPQTTWPMQRGTACGDASGIWPGGTGDWQEWVFRGRPRQKYEPGVPVWASPAFAVVEGRPLVFLGGCDQTVHAIDLAAGRRVWFKIANGHISDAPAVGEAGGRPAVFWGASDRFVYAQSAADGRLLWSRELVPPTNTQGDTLIPAPCYDRGVLYVVCFVYDRALAGNRQQAFLFALDAGDGRPLWQREVAQGPVNAPTGCRIDGDLHLFLAARKGILSAYRASRTGLTPAWSFQMPHEVLGSPSVSAGDAPKLFLGSKFGDLIALDARTGRKLWRCMTGNWVDNNACVGVVAGRQAVFVGSNDYRLYALDADDGTVLWRRPLGGEIYSAPCFFTHRQRSFVAAACLDNHLYVVDAATGSVETSFHTGEPTWDKVSKGETLWGSPIALVAGESAALVHGSYDGAVYLFRLDGASRFRVRTQDAAELWLGLLVVGLSLVGVVLPVLLCGAARPNSR